MELNQVEIPNQKREIKNNQITLRRIINQECINTIENPTGLSCYRIPADICEERLSCGSDPIMIGKICCSLYLFYEVYANILNPTPEYARKFASQPNYLFFIPLIDATNNLKEEYLPWN